MSLRVAFVSLGCAKNLVDTEVMMGLVERRGWALESDPAEADAIVVNTCAFIEPARREAMDTILEMARFKETGRARVLVVTGCLAQLEREGLSRPLPEVDAVLGPGACHRLGEVIDRLLSGEGPPIVDVPPTGPPRPEGLPRVLATPHWRAYLRIAEGCDNRCTYCRIPELRGPLRSRPPEVLVDEATALARLGVRELTLIAQDTTCYGMDTHGRSLLTSLLRTIAALADLNWVRILYLHPERVDDELLDTIASNPRICSYLDIPVQHGSDRILRLMGRRGTREDAADLVRRARRLVPGITLRTTVITGFPGETSADFERLLDLIRELRFDHLGVFAYSPEDGVPAASLPGPVPRRLRLARRRRALRLQQAVAAEQLSRWVGQEVEVLVEGWDEARGRPCLVGRFEGQAPEVDGRTYVFDDAHDKPVPGTFVRALVTGNSAYDLFAVPVAMGSDFQPRE